MGGSQSSPTPTSDEIEAVRDRREMSSMVSGIVLDPSERLFDSCWRGDVKGCKRDLRDGAHVDWAHHIFSGRTALHAAAFQEHGKVVHILLSNGADAFARDSEGRTPVDYATLSEGIWPFFDAAGAHVVSLSCTPNLLFSSLLAPL